MGIQTPSLARVKSFKLPHIQPPIQVFSFSTSVVFHIAYCEYFSLSIRDEWQELCQEFVSNVKLYMPAMLHKQKIHLILHLTECMEQFGPSSVFNAERFESLNSRVRTFNVFNNRLAPSRDMLQHLQFLCHDGQMMAEERMLFVEFHTRNYARAVLSIKSTRLSTKDSSLVNVGDYIEISSVHDQSCCGSHDTSGDMASSNKVREWKLCEAAVIGDVQQIIRLLDQGADIDAAAALLSGPSRRYQEI
ncbi:hypothetical protein EMCRGX_G000326 [Ephydatia muelleri]